MLFSEFLWLDGGLNQFIILTCLHLIIDYNSYVLHYSDIYLCPDCTVIPFVNLTIESYYIESKKKHHEYENFDQLKKNCIFYESIPLYF